MQRVVGIKGRRDFRGAMCAREWRNGPMARDKAGPTARSAQGGRVDAELWVL